jgi:hypothetical protein
VGDPLYRKIFVRSDGNRSELQELICRMTGGENRRWTIQTEWGEVDVMDNEDFDPKRKGDPAEGFLFYRFYLDVEPVKSVGRETYVKEVGRLLGGLWKSGLPATAACRFEDELPRTVDERQV